MRLLLAAVYPPLYTLGLLLYLPVQLWRASKGTGKTATLLQRAKLPEVLADLPAGKKPRVWMHAVSVGEVRTIAPLVPALKKVFGDVLISTTTETGQLLARQLFEGEARVFYFPLDWKWLCRRYLRRARPDLILLAESEFWPGFLGAATQLGIPVVLINGRISDRSFRRYRRFRFLIRHLLQPFSHLCMQTKDDERRVLALGAAPSLVTATGNLKYDYRLPANPAIQRLAARLRALLKPTEESQIWIWGSTREGEEAVLLEAFKSLHSEFPDLNLLVAPRHPHRAPEVADLLRQAGLNSVLRSELADDVRGGGPGGATAVVLDTIGELAQLYKIADLVFIGGSLVPWGGHNIIEAANFGRPILFGPHMQNFREISQDFLEAYAALQVGSQTDLAEKTRELLKDRAARQWLGRNARAVIRNNQGALARTMRIVRECSARSGAIDHSVK